MTTPDSNLFYLDNAATTWPKPAVVYETLDSSFRQMFSPKRGTAKAAQAGTNKLLAARQVFANLFHIEDPNHVVFTCGCTHALNLAIQAFPWQAGDWVLMSALEHHALSRPIRKMAREKGIHFEVVPYTTETPFDLVAYEALLQKHPVRLVATTHASNVIGSILPVAEIGRLAHAHGALYLVDAAQTAGLLDINVKTSHIDMLAFPGHKSLYGPPGIGGLYVGPDVQLDTWMEGGTGNDSGKHPMHPTLPDGFEVGTISLPQIVAFAAGAQWVSEQGLNTIRAHESDLLTQLLDGLRNFPEITVYGHQRVADKTPVVSMRAVGFENDPKALGARLFDEYGIALRAGFHCAPMAHEAIGTIAHGGTLRASLGYFTQPQDIEAFLKALKGVLGSVKAPALS